jgi:heme exporter protein C
MTAVKSMPLAPEAAVQALPARPRLLTVLTLLTAVATLVSLYMGLVYARTEIDQGDVQRLFYFHVPSFFGGFIAFTCTLVGGVAYLRTRNLKWDRLALAGVEVGLALSMVNLLTGMFWARPIWNTWWTWDPRLTSEAIMILTYFAYLMLRAGIENADTRRRFAAIYGVLAFVTVVITLIITRIRPDTIHPVVIGPSVQTEAQGMFDVQGTEGVRLALYAGFIPWAILIPVTLMWYRIRLEALAERAALLKARLLER